MKEEAKKQDRGTTLEELPKRALRCGSERNDKMEVSSVVILESRRDREPEP